MAYAKKPWARPEGAEPYKPKTTPAAAGMPSWTELLERAVNEPGTLSAAYSAFHRFSIGNQMLAAWQCHARGIPLGPIATYAGWVAKGRHVQKEQKALCLCMPVTGHKRREDEDSAEAEDGAEEDKREVFTFFVYRNRWFVLSQTDGKDFPTPEIPGWDKAKALSGLGIEEVAFDLADGNVLGYATKGRKVAVSPLNPCPEKTLMHEIAHIVLGHTEQDGEADTSRREIREMEAEATTLIVSEVLHIGNPSDSRGYIQNWHGKGNAIPEVNAKRIFAGADKIIKAGKPKQEAEAEAA